MSGTLARVRTRTKTGGGLGSRVDGDGEGVAGTDHLLRSGDAGGGAPISTAARTHEV